MSRVEFPHGIEFVLQLLLASMCSPASECVKLATKQPADFIISVLRGFACFAFNVGQHLLMKINYRLYWKIKPDFKVEVWVPTSKIQSGLVSAKGKVHVSPLGCRLLCHILCFLGLFLILSTYLCWGS